MPKSACLKPVEITLNTVQKVFDRHAMPGGRFLQLLEKPLRDIASLPRGIGLGHKLYLIVYQAKLMNLHAYGLLFPVTGAAMAPIFTTVDEISFKTKSKIQSAVYNLFCDVDNALSIAAFVKILMRDFSTSSSPEAEYEKEIIIASSLAAIYLMLSQAQRLMHHLKENKSNQAFGLILENIQRLVRTCNTTKWCLDFFTGMQSTTPLVKYSLMGALGGSVAAVNMTHDFLNYINCDSAKAAIEIFRYLKNVSNFSVAVAKSTFFISLFVLMMVSIEEALAGEVPGNMSDAAFYILAACALGYSSFAQILEIRASSVRNTLFSSQANQASTVQFEDVTEQETVGFDSFNYHNAEKDDGVYEIVDRQTGRVL